MESKDKIYGNRRVYHPDGTLMFYCDDKRANWYLDRNLATVQADPLAIQLNFIPNGHGHKNDPFYLTPRENKCVVCGSLKDLTRHHAVPYCFRKHFPEKMKARSSHDIVPLCIECHHRYEEEALRFKKKLAIQYNVSFECGEPLKEDVIKDQAGGAARSLLKYWDQIPEDRRQYLLSRVAAYLGKPCTLEDVIQNYGDLTIKSHEITTRVENPYGKRIVDKLEDLHEFMRMWRQHFVDVMKPEYLTLGWDVNHVRPQYLDEANKER